MEIFLARQPIFDIKQKVYAYEILYRSGHSNEFDGTEGDKASTEVIINTFQTFGIDNLTNRKPVFINFTENLICDEVATLFPKDLLVVEILENVNPNKGIIEKCKMLKKKGYRIALDDFVNKPEYEPLVELADIIKIDFMNTERDEIERTLENFKKFNLEFLAEKVETREDFEYAKKLGFKYFQGYFFSKPEIVKSKKLLPIKANYIQLINEANQLEINFKKIANIISRDLSLTYNLLKLVNSAAFGFRYKINNVQHALVALGEREIKKWIHLLVLNDMGSNKPDELTRLSLIRARFAELISKETKYKNKSDDMFLLGLFSLLDVILGKLLEEVLEEVQATDMIKEGLLRQTGEVGALYKMIISYEKGEWNKVVLYSEKLGIDSKLVIQAYMDALSWYTKLVE